MSLPSDLPIQALLPQIQQVLTQHNTAILQAEPGAGKSTQVPLALMNAPYLAGRKILLLEPRRLAVRTLAYFLAKQLGEKVGQRVGYQVRNDRKTSAQTQLEIITEGVLIRRLQQDPELSNTALIIFDEFHERSLEADLALALTLECQTELRDDLKILLMSATLESNTISGFLNNAPIIHCPGRSFPVHRYYLDKPISTQRYDALYTTLTHILCNVVEKHSGDCLIFLAGQKEIFTAIRFASKALNTQDFVFLPLYGGLSPDAQNNVLQPDSKNRRKIIFATNIAETSVTIEGIRCVIDSGLVRKAQYDPSSGMTRMVTQKTSKASATQRAGRAGRLCEGHAYCLWTESEQQQKPDFETEAILTSDLSDLTLETAMWGEDSPYNLRWLTPPPKPHYDTAKQLLTQLAFLNPKGGITPLGNMAAQLGLPCRLAKMLLSCPVHQQQVACDLAAILSERDLFKKAEQLHFGADIAERLQALQAYRNNKQQALTHYPLIISSTSEAMTNSRNWLQRLSKITHPENNSKKFPPTHAKETLSIGQLIALAYPDRIAKRRAPNDCRYQLSNGKGTVLKEHDKLTQEPWLVVAELDGQRREGLTYLACAITLTEIETLFATQIKEQVDIQFDAKKQSIQGVTKKTLGALSLHSFVLSKLRPEQIQTCLIHTLKTSNLAGLPWSKKTSNWLNRVRWLGQYLPEFEGFSEQELLEEFDNWCAPYLTHIQKWRDLAKLDLLNLLKARLNFKQHNTLDKEAPSMYTAPSNKRVPIHYQTDKPPYVAIQLQELFGETHSPRLANGQISLTFELLSPAQRPIQITSDLAHFWQNSYIEVAKEMRGKYRRHRWPEKPLEERAGKSIQTRKK
ncbi:ATP-dependent helicase HrpB [hydrothermal vent metagenome]|uniref:ATP-dependent helicase HrpB n=1 Tax=hydrothermal vent metagenome TaxID=652676 RepID=A0A3B0VUV2_9ZZZZ